MEMDIIIKWMFGKKLSIYPTFHEGNGVYLISLIPKSTNYVLQPVHNFWSLKESKMYVTDTFHDFWMYGNNYITPAQSRWRWWKQYIKWFLQQRCHLGHLFQAEVITPTF